MSWRAARDPTLTLEALPEEPLELVALHDVGRIRHDDREGAVLRLLGHELEAEHPLERDRPEELGVDPERPEIDVRESEAVGELAGARLLGGGIEEPRHRGFGRGGSGRAHRVSASTALQALMLERIVNMGR